MDALLKLLKGNARLSNSELAVMLNCSEKEIADQISRYESERDNKGLHLNNRRSGGRPQRRHRADRA